MVKKINSLNLERQKKRAAIQVHFKKSPKSSDTEMANIFDVSRFTVSKWKKRTYFTDKVRKRKSRLNLKLRKFLIKKAANRFTGIENASSRKLSLEIKNKFSVYISKTTVNKWLNKLINKPKKATTTFILEDKDKDNRIKFAEWIRVKQIKGKSIFFTDEKRFILNSPLNRQTNQIRLDHEGEYQYKIKKGEIFEKVAKPQPKFSKGIMVGGGICFNGVGKLIFIIGTMRTFSYLQALKLYKADIERLGSDLYFQQDNAPCHTSKSCLNYIHDNFQNKLEFWPANSPDLSPIEELWALVQEKLSKYSFANTSEMVLKLQYIWNRIPKRLCQHLILSFDKKIEIIKDDGERANKRVHSIHTKIGNWINRWNENDSIERIIYNQKELEIMKKRKIRELKKELKEIKKSYLEEKARYSKENKDKIKAESKELFKFFLNEEKNMKNEYDNKILEKNKEISSYEQKKDQELFDTFTNEEKINSISFGKKKLDKNLESTKEYSFEDNE